MGCDFSGATFVALYVASMHILHTNSRTSTHWRLNQGSGKVEAAPMAADRATAGDENLYHQRSEKCGNENEEYCEYSRKESEEAGDLVMDILMLPQRVTASSGDWLIEEEPRHCYENCDQWMHNAVNRAESSNHDIESTNDKTKPSDTTSSKSKKKKSSVLDCGKPVDSTPFDHLTGVMNRHTLEHLAEPEVAMIFRNKGNPDVDLTALQAQLRKAKKEKPRSSQIYNQIGNYWRIKGDTQRSVECFRKALSLSPNNSDALLNLARVLFNLRYLDDAYELTRVSLATQSPDQNSWLQHFTLGEILKARGRHHEAGEQFRHTLDLHPGFHPAQVHLHEVESILSTLDSHGFAALSLPSGMLTYYTLFIILLLVLAVLYGILATIDGGLDEAMGSGDGVMKTPRHFNRAMAMRSIKLGINHKLMRMRRQQYG